MATRDHSSTMKMKGKHAFNDAGGKLLGTARLGDLLKYYPGCGGQQDRLLSYRHSGIHPTMWGRQYLGEVEP